MAYGLAGPGHEIFRTWWKHATNTIRAADVPPSVMTIDGEEWSTTTPPTSAPMEMVAWNEAVKSTEEASGESGEALANQVCEQTGTAP